MKLRREGEQSRPLSEPITVSFDAVRTGWLGREQTVFKIYQPESPGRWHLYSPGCSATEERNRIRDYYIKVEKFGKEEMAKLLGTSPASLYRDVKDADWSDCIFLLKWYSIYCCLISGLEAGWHRGWLIVKWMADFAEVGFSRRVPDPKNMWKIMLFSMISKGAIGCRLQGKKCRKVPFLRSWKPCKTIRSER